MEDALSAINHMFTFGLATFVLVSIILKDWVDQRRKLQAQQQKIIDAITGGGGPQLQLQTRPRYNQKVKR